MDVKNVVIIFSLRKKNLGYIFSLSLIRQFYIDSKQLVIFKF
jgi:hypothetical protein